MITGRIVVGISTLMCRIKLLQQPMVSDCWRPGAHRLTWHTGSFVPCCTRRVRVSRSCYTHCLRKDIMHKTKHPGARGPMMASEQCIAIRNHLVPAFCRRRRSPCLRDRPQDRDPRLSQRVSLFLHDEHPRFFGFTFRCLISLSADPNSSSKCVWCGHGPKHLEICTRLAVLFLGVTLYPCYS